MLGQSDTVREIEGVAQHRRRLHVAEEGDQQRWLLSVAAEEEDCSRAICSNTMQLMTKALSSKSQQSPPLSSTSANLLDPTPACLARNPHLRRRCWPSCLTHSPHERKEGTSVDGVNRGGGALLPYPSSCDDYEQ
ncbi:hypothetical protein B296_00029155 [Ensete ventricosum]|uniref:Uncharacterized protein n=1 Tax=Ensete ventricosum TaxID=4639 RepID=A0A426ZQN4_ENSVE|nr:hypothetical protein B296_00029155 [Ensete ventricosum]